MSDCPNNDHGHELEWKNNYRLPDPQTVEQSGYCIHCGDEVKRVYEYDPEYAPSLTDSHDLFQNGADGVRFTDELWRMDIEQVGRKVVCGDCGEADWVVYTARYVRDRSLVGDSAGPKLVHID